MIPKWCDKDKVQSGLGISSDITFKENIYKVIYKL